MRARRETKDGQKDRPVRVALIQHWDARDVRKWSGTIYFSKAAIERHVGPVVDLSPSPIPLLPFRVARQLIRRLTGQWYSYEHDMMLARFLGGIFSRRIARAQPDLVFAPAASGCVGFLNTKVPIVYYSDATFRVMRDYNAGFTNVVGRTAKGGEELERRAIEKAALALFSSEWAAESAIRDYGADPNKVETVYIGANMGSPPRREEVLPRKLPRKVRMLMVAVSWERKGGPIAMETLRRLLEMGFDVELNVVGCAPPEGTDDRRIRVIPFLNKSLPEDRARFDRLWKGSDLLLLPTRYEAAGLVFCEAGAYGVPVVTTRTGGTPALVINGRNGITLDPEAGGEQYAEAIAEVLSNPDAYERLCEGSRDEFEARLNWEAWGRRVAELVEERIPGFEGRTVSGGAGAPADAEMAESSTVG